MQPAKHHDPLLLHLKLLLVLLIHTPRENKNPRAAISTIFHATNGLGTLGKQKKVLGLFVYSKHWRGDLQRVKLLINKSFGESKSLSSKLRLGLKKFWIWQARALNGLSNLRLLQQLETAMAEKESQADRWEFPRHRLKVFHILGEGCFGQVWKCEAIDIDGEFKSTLSHRKQFHHTKS